MADMMKTDELHEKVSEAMNPPDKVVKPAVKAPVNKSIKGAPRSSYSSAAVDRAIKKLT